MGRKRIYISKEKLKELLIDAYENGISDELHIEFYNFAKQIASKSNFHNYTWVEDMASDAYIKCIDVVKRKKFVIFAWAGVGKTRSFDKVLGYIYYIWRGSWRDRIWLSSVARSDRQKL